MSDCPKCNGFMTGPTYSEVGINPAYQRECLIYRCTRCGYVRAEPTQDQLKHTQYAQVMRDYEKSKVKTMTWHEFLAVKGKPRYRDAPHPMYAALEKILKEKEQENMKKQSKPKPPKLKPLEAYPESDPVNYVLFDRVASGKTEVILRGAERVRGAIVVCANRVQAVELQSRCKGVRFITLSELDKCRGMPPGPIVFDHFAYAILWDEMKMKHRAKCEMLEQQIRELESKLSKRWK